MRPTLRAFAALASIGLAGFASSASSQEPAKSASLAKYFPGKDLVVYAEFDGLDAHSAAWKKTAAYKLLTETTTGVMLESMGVQLLDRMLAASPPHEKKPTGEEMVAVATHLIHSGFAFGINRRAGEPKPYSIGVVIRGGAAGPARPLFARLIDSASGPNAKPEPVTKPGDRRVISVAAPNGAGFAWWTEQDDLAMSLVKPSNVDAMIDALDGRVPNATENPIRAGLAKIADGFEPVGLAYFDMAALPFLPPQAATLGLDRVKRLDYRWGFQDDALMTVTRLVAPSPRSGVLAMLDQPTFTAKTLPPIPSGVNGFTAYSFDPDRFYDLLATLSRAADPKSRKAFADGEAMFRQVTGQRLREDVLKHIGPRMTLYTVPTRGNLPTNALTGFASGLLHVPKTTLMIEIRDREGFARSFDALAARANELIRAQAAGNDPERAKGLGFLPLKGDIKGYVVATPPAAFPIPAGMRPTIILGEKYLVLGTTPAVAKAALAVESKTADAADGALAKAIGRLPKDLVFVSIVDTRESLLPDVVANLPGLVGMLSSMNGPNPLARLRGFGPPQSFNLSRPGGRGLRVRIDPEEIPSPDDLRPFLFPATYAMVADDEGFRFITRESFPSINPTTALPLAAAVALPGVTSARSAAMRSQSINDMKQIGLAIHNHVSANNTIPGPIRDKNGKPLLSWRVAILPFLEQAPLFNEFHLDEPWDSPHNRTLLDRMPQVYAIPNSSTEPGKTFYRSFSGPRTLFDPSMKDGINFAHITDGTSNTLALVEARQAVEWTRPDNEIPFDEKEPTGKPLLEQLGGHFPGGFNALMLDGSVRFLKETVNPIVLKALVTRDGGEVISGDSF